MNSEALILLLDAVRRDDDTMMRSLIRRFPLMAKKQLTYDEIELVYPPSKMVNHFYTTDDGTFGLVLEDYPVARMLAKECDLDAFIFWGPNSDPVEVCTIAKVADVMCASDEHGEPTRVLALLNAVGDKTQASLTTHGRAA